jgi:hypothetical protein
MLRKIPIPADHVILPRELTRFIEVAEERVDEYQESVGEQLSPRFEPADHQEVAEALVWLRREMPCEGARFCEWGCGFGVVAGLADLLGFEAFGIEVDPVVFGLAEELRALYGLGTRLWLGNFLEPVPANRRAFDPARFDLIYAYPWPGEEDGIKEHFDRHAAETAYLLLFLGFGDLRLYQK